MRYVLPALTLFAFLSLELSTSLDASGKTQPIPHVPERLSVHPPELTMTEVIRAAARKHGVPRAMIRSVIAAESNFNPVALSDKGAVGLMQLMPETAAELGADPHIPEQNIEAGTHYLRQLQSRYRNRRDSWIRAIAAYNAGPGNVDRYSGIPPFPETQQYVKRVFGYFKRYSASDSADHSSLRADIGSSLEARRAGTTHAISAAANNVTATAE